MPREQVRSAKARFRLLTLPLHYAFRIMNSALQALACLVGPSGLEPPTSCLSGTRSNLLSYEPLWLVSDCSHLNFGGTF